MDPPTMSDGEIIARLERDNAALLAACEAVEWAGRVSYPGKSSRCCPECGGIKPDPELRPGEKRDESDWAEEAYGHRDWCNLKSAIDLAKPPNVAAEKGA